MRIVLLHSPLVGPTTWTAVASLLRHMGYQVVVPDLRAAATVRPPYQPAMWRAVTDALDRADGAGPLVLVGHSGAGPLLPGLATACGHSVHALIYVDAGLPRPGTNWFERAPTGLADHVRRLVENGRLPPWDEWFDGGVLEALLPDPAMRAQFRKELPRVPLTFLTEATPPATWAELSGYLLLSEAYLANAAEARANRWPVLEHLSHHLAMLTDPAGIADAIRRLCWLLITKPGRD
jgi:pimeloyl-ACP methyl ester carboxylesterase